MTAGPSPQPSDDDFRNLLAACIDAIGAGGHDAAEPVLAANPQHAEALRGRLRKLAAAGLLPTPEPTSEPIPERLGDFRLIRRLGAGGMGVVYLAVQESLGREVALKLVKPDQLYFPGARERFRREVEAIARLHDPGIVGIHTVGEEGGIPFFAMEHIAGATLADVLQHLAGRRPQDLTGPDLFAAVVARTPEAPAPPSPPALFADGWTDACVRVAEAMARALVHAHAQGVLHRDLKPSNVMLTPSGRVVLLDFGLAQARGAAKITRSGAQLGSLHTMAPEQVRGQAAAIDERTDVYALGVVFYELLTLHLPFHGATSDEVARRILDAAPRRPRDYDPRLPWDVETVCLSAMDPDRERRYPSASALLRDLRNLLAKRPIEARPPGALLRLRRFAQRHRALAAAAVVASLALVATPAVVAVRERELNATLRETIGDRDREMTRARQNAERASQALNKMLQLVADEDLDQVPDLRRFTERLLRETGAQLDELSAGNPTEPAACLLLAETLDVAGNLYWRCRDSERADAALSQALRLLDADPERLRAVAPDRFAMVRLDVRLARALLRSPRLPKQDYLAELQQIVGDPAGDAEPGMQRAYHHRRAVGLERLGRELAAAGPERTAEAALVLDRSLAIRRRLAAEFGDTTALLEVATAETARFVLPGFQRDANARQAALARADEVLAKAAATEPTDDGVRRQLANQLVQRAQVLRTNDAPRARQWIERAIELFERSIADRPSRVATRIEHTVALRGLAVQMLLAGERAESLAVRQRVTDLLRALLATWPESAPARLGLLDNELDLVRLLATDPARAADAATRFRALAEDARRAGTHEHPLATVLSSASTVLVEFARSRLRENAVDEAFTAIGEALELDARGRRLGESQRVSLGSNQNLQLVHAEVLLRRGDRAGALAALRAVNGPLPKDLRSRVPGLAEVAAEPGFAELLRAAEGR